MKPDEARAIARELARELRAVPPATSLGIDAASASLGIGRDSLYALLDVEGGIPTFRVGGRRLIRVADLEAFAARRVAEQRMAS